MLNKILRETNFWILVGLALPVVGFISLLLLNFYEIGFIHNVVSLGFAILFSVVAVLWWWWALSKIIQFAIIIKNFENKIVDLKKDISKVKTDISNI
jgi:hypothetical protein